MNTPARIRRFTATLGAGLASLVFAGCGLEPAEGRAAAPIETVWPLRQDEVLPVGPTCTPNGAHAKHGFVSCRSCHSCGGVLQFASPGPAIGSGPSPTFDATTKTCSGVACHGVSSGTFTYPFQGGDGEVVWNTVSYGGGEGSVTPSWYESFGTCGGCHGNPPGGGYAWHSRNHMGQGPTGFATQCQFCHPDAVSTNGIATGLSTATNCGPNGTYGVCAALHNNGTLEVWAKFTPRCMYCH